MIAGEALELPTDAPPEPHEHEIVSLAEFDIPYEPPRSEQTLPPESDCPAIEQSQPTPEIVSMFTEACEDPVFLRIAQRIVGSVHADDIVQQALEKAWKTLGSFEDRGMGIRPWLCRIVENTGISHCRHVRVEEKYICPTSEEAQLRMDFTPDPHGSAEEVALDREHSALERALNRLPPNFREAVQAVHIEGYQHHEYAEKAGFPVGTSLSRSSRGRRQLLALVGLTPEDARQGRGEEKLRALIMGIVVAEE